MCFCASRCIITVEIIGNPFMKLARVLAGLLPALVICFSLMASAHAQAPSAAPTGDPAQSAPLAAPTGSVGVQQTGAETPRAGSMSLVSLVKRADPVVQVVLALLLIASICCWAIIINKSMALGTLKRRATKFEKIFWSGRSLDDLYQQFAPKPDHPMAAVFISALREWRRA